MTREEIINDAMDKITEVLGEPRYLGLVADIAATLMMWSMTADASAVDDDITPDVNKYLNLITNEICEATNEIWLEKQKKNLKVN